MVWNKIGYMLVRHDPNPWVLSQYASERNPKTFLAAEQYKSCFNSNKVSPQYHEALLISNKHSMHLIMLTEKKWFCGISFCHVVKLSCSYFVYKL